MKIHIFIPARYESTRFPGKPLATIEGKPMIQHVYERARACPNVSGVYVATDDTRISTCVDRFGGRAIITAKTHQSGTDRICEAAQSLGIPDRDIVLNIQGDQPLFEPLIVARLVKSFREARSVVMATLRRRMESDDDAGDPHHVKVVSDTQGFALYFSRSPIPCYREREANAVHYRHVGVYAFRMEFLKQFTALPEGVLERAEKLEQLRALENGFKIKMVDSPFESVEVDIPEDVRAVEKLLRRNRNKRPADAR